MLSARPSIKTIHALKAYLFGNLVANLLNDYRTVSISDFYEYVFTDKAEIKSISHVAAKKSKKKVTEQEASTRKIRSTLQLDEIYEKKTEVLKQRTTIFTELLGDAVLADPNFRPMLRQTKAQAFETLLYGNASDPLDELALEYQFPSDDEIKMTCVGLNLMHPFYENNSPEFQKAKEIFVVLYKGCKLIADFVEKNNTPDNFAAALHAFKILIFFGASQNADHKPFERFERYLKVHQGYKQPNPIHDALVTELSHDLRDLAGWQAFIHQYGPKALRYFENALAIEIKLDQKAPKNLEQAAMIAAENCYQRHQEYPLLANLCMQYNATEETFNRCLELDKKRKTSDLLPDYSFDIDGASISPLCEGYHLLKFPMNDPRIYLLGYISACCQNVNGLGEDCVINGLTYQDHGFYGSLKRNRKSLATSRVRNEDGSINYQDFAIVGQGYVWLSRLGNLTFDSWENLRPGNGLLACALLKLPDEFASANIMRDIPAINEYLENGIKEALILFRGKIFFVNINSREIMELSLQKSENLALLPLFDSLEENKLVKANEEEIRLISSLIGDIGSQDDAITVAMLTDFAKKITHDPRLNITAVTIGTGGKTPLALSSRVKLRSPEEMAQGEQYGDSKNQVLIYKNKDKLEPAISALINTIQDLFPSFRDKDVRLLRSFISADDITSSKQIEQISELINEEQHRIWWMGILSEFETDDFARSFMNNIQAWSLLYSLHDSHLLNEDNYTTILIILSDRRKASIPELANALNELNQAKILAQWQFRYMSQNLHFISEFSKLCKLLCPLHLIQKKHYPIIWKIKSKTHFASLREMLQELDHCNLLTQDHVDFVFDHLNSLDSMNQACHLLAENNFLNTENIKAIFTAEGNFAYEIASLIITLKQVGLYNPCNCDLVIKCANNPDMKQQLLDDIQTILIRLNKARLLSQTSFIEVMDNMNHAHAISLCLPFLFVDPAFTAKYWNKLLRNVEHADALGYIFRLLYDCKMLPDNNYIAEILSKAEHAEIIRSALYTLLQADQKSEFITEINVNAILAYPQYAKQTAEAIVNHNSLGENLMARTNRR